MEIDQSRIDDLVARPSESLNVEIKRWIDPAEPEGQAKIIKAAFAIASNGTPSTFHFGGIAGVHRKGAGRPARGAVVVQHF